MIIILIRIYFLQLVNDAGFGITHLQQAAHGTGDQQHSVNRCPAIAA